MLEWVVYALKVDYIGFDLEIEEFGGFYGNVEFLMFYVFFVWVRMDLVGDLNGGLIVLNKLLRVIFIRYLHNRIVHIKNMALNNKYFFKHRIFEKHVTTFFKMAIE